MNEKLTKRDWETISAYLDGQLSSKKLVRFETRLSQEPQLRLALDDLQKTRQVLRHAPRRRVPRNFLLTPQMAGQPRRLPRLAPAFGWVSAAATLLFAIVMVGDLFIVGGAIPVAFNAQAPQPAMVSQEIAADQGVEMPMMAEPAALDASAAGGFSEAAEPEIQEGEVALEVAAAPAMESAPPEPATEESLTIEEAVIPVEEPTLETDLTVAAEAPLAEPSAEKTAAFTDTARSAETGEVFTFSATTALTPTLETTLPVIEGGQHIETTAAPEFAPDILVTKSTPTLFFAETSSQPTDEAPLAPQSKASDSETGVEIALNSADSALETNPDSNTEQSQPATSGQSGNVWAGVEASLLLLALAAGIAWVYLRRRGG